MPDINIGAQKPNTTSMGNPVPTVSSAPEEVATKVQNSVKSFTAVVDELESTVVELEKGLKGVPKSIEEQKDRVAKLNKRISSIFA